MGWQDREYAKWTDEERRRFYGFGSVSPRRGILRPTAGLAALASLAIALGLLPLRHSLFSTPLTGGTHALSAPANVATIGGPSSATVGSTLSLNGPAPDGMVTVEKVNVVVYRARGRQ